jgi:tellurite resistance protein
LSASLDAPPPTTHWHTRQPDQSAGSKKELVELTIEFAYAVARTDGSISSVESALINEQMQRRFSYDQALYNRVKAWCAHYQTAAIGVDLCLRRIKETTQIAHRAKLLEFACQIAEASGPANQREARLIERIAQEWEITPQRLAAAAQVEAIPSIHVDLPSAQTHKPPPLREDPKAVLGIDSKTPLTADLIRRQFSLRNSQLMTSERLEAMGQEFIALAEAKRNALRAAAEALISPLGELLEPLPGPAVHPELRHNPDLDSMFGD